MATWSDGPGFVPKRARGAKARGLAYERAVGRELAKRIVAGEFGSGARLLSHEWIRFQDRNGPGFAQFDYAVVHGGGVLLVEVKLTQTTTAVAQLKGLYEPLVWALLRRPVACLQVCRNLVWADPGEVASPAQATPGPASTWHFIH